MTYTTFHISNKKSYSQTISFYGKNNDEYSHTIKPSGYVYAVFKSDCAKNIPSSLDVYPLSAMMEKSGVQPTDVLKASKTENGVVGFADETAMKSCFNKIQQDDIKKRIRSDKDG